VGWRSALSKANPQGSDCWPQPLKALPAGGSRIYAEKQEEVVEGQEMNSDTSARLLWAGVGGIICAGIARALAPMGRGLAQAVLEGMVLIVVSLVIYRFMARRSPDE